MTNNRLNEILDEISDNGTRIMRPHMVMKAMKQAVNEAIQECIDNADIEVMCQHGYGVLDKDELLNLKVK